MIVKPFAGVRISLLAEQVQDRIPACGCRDDARLQHPQAVTVLVPLGNYVFFLAQLQTFGYVAVYFAALLWRYRYFDDIVLHASES